MDAPTPLAFAHPLVAIVVLTLAFTSLRSGLAMRRQRRRGITPPTGSLGRHLRLGVLVPWLWLGLWTSGLLSGVLLRGWSPLGTAHGWVATLTTVGFLVVWRTGLGLKHKRTPREQAGRHGIIAIVVFLLAVLAAVLGIAHLT